MKSIKLVFFLLFISLSIQNPQIPRGLFKGGDWLVTEIDTKSNVTETKDTLTITNGLISKTFLTNPGFACIDFRDHYKDESILRAIAPEANLIIDNNHYAIGDLSADIGVAYMNFTDFYSNLKVDDKAFKFTGYSVSKPETTIPYTPMRHAPKDIKWPLDGVHLKLEFQAPSSIFHPDDTTATVHYEIFDGVPLLVKWVTVNVTGSGSHLFSADYIDTMRINRGFDRFSGAGQLYRQIELGKLQISSNQPHGVNITWARDAEQKDMPGSFEPTYMVQYSDDFQLKITNSTPFESFRVFQFVVGTLDHERTALSRNKKYRLLAPWVQENPVFMHLTTHPDNETGVKYAIDQMADVGFEMLIFSFGSGINMESTDDKYISYIKGIVDYAQNKNIEVGGYDLICWTRTPPNSSWDLVNQDGQKEHNSCFASGWYDDISKNVFDFMNKTGVSMIETDGPYPGYTCYSKDHEHHTDHTDSVYQQTRLQGDFYKNLRERNVFVNQPDEYFFQGGNKAAFGYSEDQYSLPRWQDLSISRQDLYDDSQYYANTMGWMQVPLVDYHAGGDAASFEPLGTNIIEYEWALSMYLGSGVAACWRGYQLYDDNNTQKVVTKWVSWYKKYRDIINSDIVQVKRPDMISIDAFLHVNYKLDTKGLMMVYNPTLVQQEQTLVVNLYYTGIQDWALVCQEEQNCQKYQLNRDYTIEVPVTLGAYKLSWFNISDASLKTE